METPDDSGLAVSMLIYIGAVTLSLLLLAVPTYILIRPTAVIEAAGSMRVGSVTQPLLGSGGAFQTSEAIATVEVDAKKAKPSSRSQPVKKQFAQTVRLSRLSAKAARAHAEVPAPARALMDSR